MENRTYQTIIYCDMFINHVREVSNRTVAVAVVTFMKLTVAVTSRKLCEAGCSSFVKLEVAVTAVAVITFVKLAVAVTSSSKNIFCEAGSSSKNSSSNNFCEAGRSSNKQ